VGLAGVAQRGLDLVQPPFFPFADAYHVALMPRLGLRHVVGFDKEFNRVPGVARVEPGEDG
jgi:predicted nucleic acid-binding protein